MSRIFLKFVAVKLHVIYVKSFLTRKGRFFLVDTMKATKIRPIYRDYNKLHISIIVLKSL